ncbi:MAG: metalloprotease [Flavobacterium sp.]|nr:MAG: metalloprotease [Flavobacterium sp.]
MKWLGRRESGNVEDRRGMSGGKLAAGGGVIGLIILVINMFMGGDSSTLINGLQDQMQQGGQEQSAPLSEADEEMGRFVKVIVADTEDVWKKIFADNGLVYREPVLVLFRDGVQTGCGNASSAAGPFYCPADQKVYMDLAFFDELRSRFGAKGGDFAVAYVIAHEIGHHVQNLLGTSSKVSEMQQNSDETTANSLSVALELQADFFAGVWARHDQQMNQMLDEGDIEEALSAANAVGDDAIQRKTQGDVNPDTFTHGTSAQRIYWFKKGFETGDVKQGNTFDQQ